MGNYASLLDSMIENIYLIKNETYTLQFVFDDLIIISN